MTEAMATALFCAMIGGVEEVRYDYDYGYIKVDCETPEYVIEAGLDKRSSLDSLQQSLFFNYITGKTPMIVIYDTDGEEGMYEYRIRTAAELAGVEYQSVLVDDRLKLKFKIIIKSSIIY